MFVFFASRRRNTRCALVTGVQTVCSSDLLAAACSELPQLAKKIADDALFGVTGGSPTHDRIDGRFGAAHADQIRSAPPEERTALGDTPYSLAELRWRSEEHTSELQSLMRIQYAVLCLQKKTTTINKHNTIR